ncbi:MAG: right-handed parallel beta-helix repeat-containing protein, partial [Candidatus Thermoplasmatota archaeon]|nr:right-handed parallel beta-helix repeat-containing protein [Candidatus Thermoplasmatota archaeon]
MSIIVFFPKKTSKLRTRLLIPLIGLFLLFGLYPMAMESAEAGTPPGYKDLDHLVSQFPSKILKEDDEYHVLADISLPATQPLFMGPGERVLFDEDVKLNLSAPPLFMGTEEDIISLGPLDPEKPWGGIYILERDPSTSTIMENVSITGSMIGIWSDKGDLALKNLQLRNNTRSGVEVRGPLGTANSLMIEDVEIINSHYYGIHLLNVADVNLKDVHMLSCGTSIRAVESELRMSDIEILESNSYGIYLKDSDLSAYELELSSTQGSNTNQIASMNSSITIGNGTISGSTIAIHIYSGSSIDISSTTISDCFVDGIKMEDSEATLTGTIIENCERNAMEIHGSILELSNVQMVNNGAGSGDLSYSSIYSDSSEAHIEDCLFTGSGYSHFEVLSSDLIIVDSILGSSGNNKITMEGGSIMTLVDILPPSNIEIKDDDSFLEYHLSFRAKVHNYTSEINIEGATVDIQDYDGNWILSTTTGSDGYTNEEIIPISRRTREGTFTYLPMTIVVQKEGYEVSTITMEGPVSEIEIALYPPNAPPTISIIEPANGTTVEGELLIEGTIEDDLGVHMIRYRFDSAVYRTVTDINVQEGGAFSFVIGTEDLSSDKHTLYLHAFD